MRLTPAFQFRTSEMPVPTRQQAKRSRKIASRFGTLVVTLLLAASVCPVGAQAPAGNQAASLPGGADAQLTSVESAARQSTGSKLETINVTMEFRDVELQEVIRMIAEKAHLNVVFDPKVVVGSKVTLKLENVKLGAALENILSTRQLTYVVRPADNILRVLPSTSAGESALETISEVVPLKYLYAPRAAKMLETVFKADEMKTQVTENKQQNQGASVAQQVQQGIAAATQGGQASQQVQSTKNLVGISYHLESNSLLLIAPPALLAKMKDMVYQLDVPANKPQQAVTRIVEINWMDADDMMSVLTKVFIPGSTSEQTNVAFGGGNGSLITITKAAQTVKTVTDTGGKDGDKQVKTKLQGLEETVLGGFSPTYKNSLVLTAPPIIMDEMVKMIKELDIPQQQVQIEARLVEMNENASRELGSTLKLTKKGATTADVSLLNSQTGTSGLATGAITKNITVFGQAYDLAGTLQAYEERNMLTTLANPRVVTLNKQAAAVSFVKQIPYITSTTSGDTVSEVVNFKDAGVDIGVLPTVTNTKNVHMAIGVTQSIKTGVVETSEGNEVPVVDKRQVQGQVIANSGDTIVMGGLRAMDLTDTTAGVPWLHQVPVLGWLFKSKTNAVSKTELFVFVTPRVLDDVIVTPEQKAHYDKIDTKWHMPDYFYDDVKTDADKN